MAHRLGDIDARLDRMEERFGGRFDQIDGRFDQMNAQMNERFDRMHEQMRVMMRWTVGAIVLIGAIITTLLAIAAFAA